MTIRTPKKKYINGSDCYYSNILVESAASSWNGITSSRVWRRRLQRTWAHGNRRIDHTIVGATWCACKLNKSLRVEHIWLMKLTLLKHFATKMCIYHVGNCVTTHWKLSIKLSWSLGCMFILYVRPYVHPGSWKCIGSLLYDSNVLVIYRQTSSLRRINSQHIHISRHVLLLPCLIHWSQVLSWKWRCT